MSMHVEWDTAEDCGVELVEPGTSLGDAEVDQDAYGLVLGGSGGGALCIEGTVPELRAFVTRLTRLLLPND